MAKLLELVDEGWIKRLSELPGAGTGYQIADLLLKDGRRIRKIGAYWGTHLELPEGYEEIEEEDLAQIETPEG